MNSVAEHPLKRRFVGIIVLYCMYVDACALCIHAVLGFVCIPAVLVFVCIPAVLVGNLFS